MIVTQVQSERRDAVQATCRKYGLEKRQSEVAGAVEQLGLVAEEWGYLKVESLHCPNKYKYPPFQRINWLYIYWSKRHSLTWCKVPKAGSSTWTFNFLKLAGVDPKSHIHKALRDHYPRQSSNTIMKDTFRCI